MNILHVRIYFTLEHTWGGGGGGWERSTKRGRNIVITPSVLSRALAPVRSHVYVSERRGRSRGAWAVTHQQRRIALYQTYLHQRREPRREPRIIHAVCFHIGYDGEDIPLQRSGAAALPYSADRRCQALGLALCRNALPRPGDARMAASQGSARHEALAASCVEAACPLSSVCLCMCVQRDSGRESAIGPSCPCCEVQH